ncbi:LysR family transcriptional regulator [Burkholderia seminalis]|uniref:LysR family transcriptional regulator n=9 Tax=Bacteria TaxID=2 RepID=A0A2S5DMZ9_9BURK|nr:MULTISPECIES: LysR family transcriptional regulator [Burkholderia]EKS9800472.1 LysR family transcriptional regulator [Burkholderia cepacia]EKS9808105.1 LysR family transcriptional regulator [Burkholderia cepacia]EKS9815675.1 LysR family transcriptional regulator [Burkholderia cepacia]EKS9823478.1 LysR family transcriptional regulator [Burkholderia cepacia]EKS9831101.1 LysR family transcriptional regulator [Burkholderia cepacia]
MLDGVSLDHLRTFVAAADEGSFSAAGRAISRAQSVVSQTIANLEAQLGVTLFERVGRYPRLTAHGENLLVDARRVVLDADALKAKARSFSAGLEPELSIVVDVMFPQQCLTDALSSFKQRFPSTPLRLHVEALGRVAELVLNGQCSLGITGTLPFLPPGLAAERLFSEEMVTVVAPGSPLAGKRGAIVFRELLNETQLVLTDRSTLTHGVDFGVQGKNIWRLADLGAKHAFLRAGLGWGHMPLWLIKEDLKEGRLVRIVLEGPSAGLMPFQATYLTDRLPGPAGRWLLERFAPT